MSKSWGEWRMRNEIKVAYIGKVAPYEPEFYNMPGYGDAGTLAQLGFIEALHNTKMGLDRVWGFRPIAHWPRVSTQFERARKIKLRCGAELRLLPLLNHFILKEISWFILVACCIVAWSVSRLGCKRILVVYNLSQPTGVVWARLWTWLTHTKLVPVIYDMAQIKSFRKSFLVRMTEPDWLDRVHEWFIPFCDGLFPITDAIPRDFAPGVKYLRVDGGVGESVVQNLPKMIKEKASHKDSPLVLMYAGSLSPWNCVRLMLEYMEVNRNADVELWIAGVGPEGKAVEEAAEKDGRIKYLGLLRQKELYEAYSAADVLLNLRDVTDPGLKYHYPSKTFEMLAMGKPTIMSDLSHTKEMYGEYCKVIEGSDARSFAKGVEYFRKMTTGMRREYGKRAKDFILNNRRWSTWGTKIGEFLEGIA